MTGELIKNTICVLIVLYVFLGSLAVGIAHFNRDYVFDNLTYWGDYTEQDIEDMIEEKAQKRRYKRIYRAESDALEQYNYTMSFAEQDNILFFVTLEVMLTRWKLYILIPSLVILGFNIIQLVIGFVNNRKPTFIFPKFE